MYFDTTAGPFFVAEVVRQHPFTIVWMPNCHPEDLPLLAAKSGIPDRFVRLGDPPSIRLLPSEETKI